MDFWATGVLVLLGCWLAVSVVCQFRDNFVTDFFRGLDHFSLIPIWSFFAPNPGTSDYHLLYRDKLADGAVSPWKEINLGGEKSLWSGLWNPGKKSKKVLSDAVSGIVSISRNMEVYGLKTTFPYLMIINYAARLPRSKMSDSTQFMILESKGFITDVEPNIVFISEMHAIGNSQKVEN